ncbi:MAG: hypothetical protein AB7D50_04360 [Bacilli bacterium]
MNKLDQLLLEMTDGFLLGIRYEENAKSAFWRDQWFSHFSILKSDSSPRNLLNYYQTIDWVNNPESHQFQSVIVALENFREHKKGTLGPNNDFDNGIFPFLRLVPLALKSYAKYGRFAGENRIAIEEVLDYILATHASEREQVSGLLFWRLLIAIIGRRLNQTVPLSFKERQAAVSETFHSINDYFSGYRHQNVMRYFAHLFASDLETGYEILDAKKKPLDPRKLKAGDYCIDFITTVFTLLYFTHNGVQYMKARMSISDGIPLAQGLLGMINRLVFLMQPMMKLEENELTILNDFAQTQHQTFMLYEQNILQEWNFSRLNAQQFAVLMKIENYRRGLIN